MTARLHHVFKILGKKLLIKFSWPKARKFYGQLISMDFMKLVYPQKFFCELQESMQSPRILQINKIFKEATKLILRKISCFTLNSCIGM